ncbi:MAG TPA: hypothetical protein VHY58_07335 [Streptosporangiaceae bacterium]|nr:hypothetical protein [Streptosporangiaceae bacterium]
MGGRGRRLFTPVNITIAVITALALSVRFYQLAGPGYLLGVTEYDDGSYLGSALHLVDGFLPYRDFVFVQPPGITVLMTPFALLAKITGSSVWAMAIARIFTTLASAAGVLVAGLLVRHRGLPTTILACGLLAIYPDSITTARTVLLEPWLALFCLLGALAIFNKDRVTDSRRRLIAGGLALGFAGAIEAWAIMPALIILVLLLPRLRPILNYLAGLAIGFLVPAVPFAATAPGNFLKDLIDAQIGPRVNFPRVGIWYRLREMFGLSNISVDHHELLVATVVILGFAVGGFACRWLITRRTPPALEWFVLGTALLVLLSFLYPDQFYFHFVAFLAPFMALAVAMPVSGLVKAAEPRAVKAGADHLLHRSVAVLTALVIFVFAFSTVGAAYRQQHNKYVINAASARSNIVSTLQRIAPSGACVLTDQVSYTVAADRFGSSVPGCSLVDDGIGADLGLSHGRTPASGAASYPAVASMWWNAFRHAQYVLLSGKSYKRVAWPTGLRTYFRTDFRLVTEDSIGDRLYVRNGIQPH